MNIKPTVSDWDKRSIDTSNLSLIKKYYNKYKRRQTVEAGDFIKFPNSKFHRVTYVWYDGTCQTMEYEDGGSFNFDHGRASYSGSLDSGVNKKHLNKMKMLKHGTVWISHRGHLCGNCATYYEIPCKVWKSEIDKEVGKWKCV